MNERRRMYIVLTIIFLVVEVLIALFVHDRFIRPYIGDVLVVILIYMFIRCFIPDGLKMLPLYVFLFATCVEVMQFFHIVELFGVEDNRFLKTLIGASFDIKDIICYAIGCILIAIFSRRGKNKVKENPHGGKKDIKE